MEEDAAVIMHNVAVFPAQIHDAPVLQRRGVPVGVLFEGKLAHLLGFRIDEVDIRHRVGTVDARQALFTRVGAGDDFPFGGIARVEEVDVGLVGRGKRFESGSVDVDFEDRPAFVLFRDACEHNAFAVPIEFGLKDRAPVLGLIDRREGWFRIAKI